MGIKSGIIDSSVIKQQIHSLDQLLETFRNVNIFFIILCLKSEYKMIW